MKNTWDRTTMRFASAHYVGSQEMLDVTFENGDHFLIAAESVVPVAKDAAPRGHAPGMNGVAAALPPPDWSRLRIGATGDVLEVPGADLLIEIPWDRIRAIADPAFRAHLAARAVERARRLGAQVGVMRRAAGLTRMALAEKAGISREALADVEAGKNEPPIDLLEDIASALGRPLRDFAEA